MGLRFRKSVKIAPGVRLNFGKKSTSVSLGGKGARFTVNNKGKKTASVGIPGTGLYYTESVGGTEKRKDQSNMKTKKIKAPKEDKPKKPITKKWWFWIIVFGIIFSIATGGGEAPDDTTLPTEAAISSVSSQESKEDIDPAESVINQEPEAPPIVKPEAEDPQQEPDADPPAEVEDVPDEVTTEPAPPSEEPKVEAPVVEESVVVAPIPEAPVVEEQPVVEPEPAVTQNGGSTGSYIGNINSLVFHSPSCKTLPKEKNRIYFDTRQEAVDYGCKPCGNCKP